MFNQIAEVGQRISARLETNQRQTNDPRITGDMSADEATLKFVQGRKVPGYDAADAHTSNAAEKGAKTP